MSTSNPYEGSQPLTGENNLQMTTSTSKFAATRRRLTKPEWAKLKRAFVFGHSLGAIAEATSISRGTLSARCARHRWSQDRPDDVEILRKILRRKNENE
jgi:hypothetical protein